MPETLRPPLYRLLLEIASLWIAAEVGYRIMLPLFGYSISYNESPLPIALYYFFWLVVSTVAFFPLLRDVTWEKRWYLSFIAALGFGALVLHVLALLAERGTLSGPELVPYTDLIFATPWYFLPKSIEILVQQTLIATLIIALSKYYTSLTHIALVFAGTFGGLHALIFLLSRAPSPYAALMTGGAIASALVFPYLILRVRSGFMASYMIHWLFYALVVILLRTWPPPGYGG